MNTFTNEQAHRAKTIREKESRLTSGQIHRHLLQLKWEEEGEINDAILHFNQREEESLIGKARTNGMLHGNSLNYQSWF